MLKQECQEALDSSPESWSTMRTCFNIKIYLFLDFRAIFFYLGRIFCAIYVKGINYGKHLFENIWNSDHWFKRRSRSKEFFSIFSSGGHFVKGSRTYPRSDFAVANTLA